MVLGGSAGDGVLVPWLPDGLAGRGFDPGAAAELRYVIVEEMVGGDVSLTVSPWPGADPLGRLRFAEDGEQEVAVTVEHLQAFLYAGRLDRIPRIGDVFAARFTADALDAAGHLLPDEVDLARLITEAYDVSAEARVVSKLAFYACLAGVVDEKAADDACLFDNDLGEEPPLPFEAPQLVPRPAERSRG
jgi:hypothetical protein